MHSGFYSIVQFQPDRFRREGVNVGVIVGSEELGTVRVRFTETSERMRRMFPGIRIDDHGLMAAQHALARRLSEVEPTEEALRSFLKKESSQLVILPPLRARVETIDATIARIFNEFVADSGLTQNVACPRCDFAFDPAASVPHGEGWRRLVPSAWQPKAAAHHPLAWLTERTSPPVPVTPLAALASLPANVTALSRFGHQRPFAAVSMPAVESQSNLFKIARRSERTWS